MRVLAHLGVEASSSPYRPNPFKALLNRNTQLKTVEDWFSLLGIYLSFQFSGSRVQLEIRHFRKRHPTGTGIGVIRLRQHHT